MQSQSKKEAGFAIEVSKGERPINSLTVKLPCRKRRKNPGQVKEVIFVKAKNVFMGFDEAIRFHDEVNAQKRLVGSRPGQDGIQHVFLKALRHHEIKKWRF